MEDVKPILKRAPSYYEEPVIEDSGKGTGILEEDYFTDTTYKLIKNNTIKIRNNQYRLREIDEFITNFKNTVYYVSYVVIGWFALKIIL